MQLRAARLRPGLRRCGRIAALALMTLVIVACADRTQVRVRQVLSRQAIPAYGAVSYVQLERSGVTIISRRLLFDRQLTLRLRPGAYRLMSWQRLCDAAGCGSLAPPVNRCWRSFTLSPHQQLQTTIRIDLVSGCRIVLSS